MSADTKERRLYPRRSHRTKVVFEDEFGDGLFYVWSEDFSQGGVFLASAIPVRLGTMLFLSFQLPGHRRPIRVTGEVVRKFGEKGMGIRFVGLADLARKRLDEFLL
jgi:uncharacterized protein (TIGR02266 family)